MLRTPFQMRESLEATKNMALQKEAEHVSTDDVSEKRTLIINTRKVLLEFLRHLMRKEGLENFYTKTTD